MNIVDSSGWLAYFADEPNAKHFQTPLKDTASLIVPSLTTYEVFKVVLRESSENDALQSIAAMQKGTVIDLTSKLAIAASILSLQNSLPMAERVVNTQFV
ncbi:MAG: type II toxin-antitoxin system VapC family toxin [Thermodesulfobacteriota bacterium]|nr:type II toxin-antitoxin system VapC family toxin [Thermodesulfobacteriota bacterium]